MENASKALLIAACVILGVTLLALMIRMFNAGAKVNEAYDLRQMSNELELYNAQFEIYDVKDNTIIDVLTLMNLAYDINTDTNYDSGRAVEIEVKVGSKIYSISRTNKLDKRNMMFDGNTQVSIYNLMNEELGLDGDKLSTSRFDSATNQTIYKYLFKSYPEDFVYHESTARVIGMKLEAYENGLY